MTHIYESLKDHATEQDIRNHFGLLQVMVRELEARMSAYENAHRAMPQSMNDVQQQQATLAANTPEEGV